MIARSLTTFLTAVALAGCAATASTIGMPAADDNDDDVISRGEFAEAFDDLDAFERFDDNDDGHLSMNEYREAVDDEIEGDAYFNGFDRNNDDRLSRTEFLDGLFDTFDRDDNGTLNSAEFGAAVEALEVEL